MVTLEDQNDILQLDIVYNFFEQDGGNFVSISTENEDLIDKSLDMIFKSKIAGDIEPEFYNNTIVKINFKRPSCEVTQEQLNEVAASLQTQLDLTVSLPDTLLQSLDDYYSLFETINGENQIWRVSCGTLVTQAVSHYDFAFVESQILTLTPQESGTEPGAYPAAL